MSLDSFTPEDRSGWMHEPEWPLGINPIGLRIQEIEEERIEGLDASNDDHM